MACGGASSQASTSYSGAARAFARLKLAYFCMLSNAPDYGVDTARETRVAGEFSLAVKASRLYRALRQHMAPFLGRWGHGDRRLMGQSIPPLQFNL